MALTSIEWKHNGMRHSYASYRLAQCKDAGKVAFELGHSSSTLVYRHYWALVSEEDGKRYFQIYPSLPESNIVPFSAIKENI
ncbi:hypothetical protein IT6_03090 [Methylacidiphilum caldifontis]|uniref:hypothetical protein n=1 Tax=Methylacidiphilum caldifontis TaxID=2795386 RepID=UPI001A90056D|nr:hypothetical protein [Methylacidiphilum caldifontis]QSR89283.1 hypothetical protein IT6_03090 [Methylacidiphilum caldifontis]